MTEIRYSKKFSSSAWEAEEARVHPVNRENYAHVARRLVEPLHPWNSHNDIRIASVSTPDARGDMTVTYTVASH